MSRFTNAFLDRFERAIMEAGDAKERAIILEKERDVARQLSADDRIALGRVQTEYESLRAILTRLDADTDLLRKQAASYRQEAAEKERKFKALYETAANLCSASGEKSKRALVEKVRAALEDAHDSLDWIPF